MRLKPNKVAAILGCLLTTLALQGCVGALLAGGALMGAVVYNDRRDTAVIASDKSLEFGIARDINDRYRADPYVQVYVNSFNNQVLLTGQVVSAEMREDLEALAQARPPTRQVFNELFVAPPLDQAAQNGDTYLTAAVRTALVGVFDLPDFDPTRVKITTNRGVVYLMGILTPVEAERVVRQVRTVRGVQGVVTLFEYVESDGRTPMPSSVVDRGSSR